MSDLAKLIVPSTGFQGCMWDFVRSDDDLAPLRKKLSMHEFRLLFESIEPLFSQQSARIQELESAIREFLSWTCYKDDEPDYIDALNNLRNLVSESK